MSSRSNRAEMAESTNLQFQKWLRMLLLQGQKQAKRSWGLTLFLWLVAIAPAFGLDIRVAIRQNVDRVTVGGTTTAVLRDAATNEALTQIPGMQAVVAEASGSGVQINQYRGGGFWIEPQNNGLTFIGDKWYRGRVLVVPTGEGITAINHVDLEQYLYGVVPKEMPAGWLPEALKAQAVAARTYALYQRQNGGNALFDVDATTRSQVYGGAEAEIASTNAAVEATQGQVVTYQGQIINAVFHSCAGGRTENSEDVWSQPLPYLRSVVSPDATMEGCRSWNRFFSISELESQFPGVGRITNISAERAESGRVVRMFISGTSGQKEVKGSQFRSAFGLYSAPYEIVPDLEPVASASGVAARPRGFQMAGRGFGHGIGLSQYGALSFAQQNWNYGQILLHYYTGTALSRVEVR